MKLLLSTSGTYLYIPARDSYTLDHAITKYQITCPPLNDIRKSSQSLAVHVAEAPLTMRPKDKRQ